MRIVKKILLCFIIILTFAKPAFAEAGLSEAGRTLYYFWDDKYAISILPGGEGAEGEDNVTFFEYEEVDDRNDSQSVKIKGVDGKLYTATDVKNDIYINFYEPPIIYRHILWGSSMIVNFETEEILYEEYFDCVENPDENYYEYNINSEECAEYRKVMEENNLSFDNPENIILNLEYAEENLEYMGSDAFLDNLGQGLIILFLVIGISILTFLVGFVLLIVGTIFMIKKKDGLKFLIIGGVLFFLPIIILGLGSFVIPFLFMRFSSI